MHLILPKIMLKPRNALAGLAAALLVGAVAPALAGDAVFRGFDDKPADPTYSYNRADFDCLPPDSLALAPGESATLADSTTGRTNLIASYPCAPWSEGGPELIYKLRVTDALELTAILGGTAADVDLDIFLLSDCTTDSCLVGANTEFRLTLTAGVYFLVVDGASLPSVSAGDFTLDLVTREVGVPLAICDGGGALPIACAGETITITDETLFEQPDLIRQYDCGTSPKSSGDVWYAVTLPGTHEVTINVRDVGPDLDTNLWLFAGCGPTAVCLDFADQNLAGSGETLTWINDSEDPLTVYLAVDAVRPPDSANAGLYTIDFQCQSNVATENTSFGSLKALYR